MITKDQLSDPQDKAVFAMCEGLTQDIKKTMQAVLPEYDFRVAIGFLRKPSTQPAPKQAKPKVRYQTAADVLAEFYAEADFNG